MAVMKFTDNQRFVEVWLEAVRNGETKKWIGEQLGLTVTQVDGKAGYLKQLGVKLPPLSNGKKKVDVAFLNSLIAGCHAGNGRARSRV